MSADLPRTMSAVRVAHDDSQFQTVGQEAHSLKSTAGFVGAIQLSRAADKVQLLCKEIGKGAGGWHAPDEQVLHELTLRVELMEGEQQRLIECMQVRAHVGCACCRAHVVVQQLRLPPLPPPPPLLLRWI